jgi:hypothetical protein
VTPTSNPERYRGELVQLANKVPPWARQILVAGKATTLLCGVLRKALNVPVSTIEADSQHRELVARFADHVLAPDAVDSPTPFPPESFDVVVIQDATPWSHCWADFIEWLKPLLTPDGAGILLLCDTQGVPSPQDLSAQAAGCGFGIYQTWPEEQVNSHYILYKVVLGGYDPFNRSVQLASRGNTDWAYNELMDIPDAYLKDRNVLAAIHAQALTYLADVAEASTPANARHFLLRAQGNFYHVTENAPNDALAFESYARILHHAGATALAARTRLAFDQAYVEEPRPITIPPQPVDTRWDALMDSSFQWPGPPPRILFLIHPAPHFGLDVLFEGLCEVLGSEQVCDWPFKPTLHGEQPALLGNYPCAFNQTGVPLAAPEIIQQLKVRQFDLLLFGDGERELPAEETRAMVHAARDAGIPVVFVDAMDECADMRPDVMAHLRVPDFDLYFKREMANFLDYGPGVYPLPFGFAESKIRPHAFPRDIPLFWAGHRRFGLRRLLLEYLERRMGLDLSKSYPTEEYADRIGHSRLGLSLFGKGYDTVRYWELPAHGCMLLSERLPIHIPHDFVDGESAIFFDTPCDMLGKLGQCFNNLQETSRIAQAGEAHFLQHHTATARARQMLHVIHETCFRKSS